MIRSTCYHTGMHLRAEKIVSRHMRCPFCGNSSSTPLFPIQENPAVTLLRCESCTAVYADAIPSTDVLDRYYAQYYSHKRKRVTCDSPAAFARHIYRCFSARLGDNVRILDFGGGDGAVSYSLAEIIRRHHGSRIEVAVVDYCASPVVSDNERIVISRSASLDSVSGSFDIVIAGSVIEHLPFPGETLRALLSRVSPGGFFYARHPYIVPLMRTARCFGISIDLTFPAHLSDFGGEFWKRFVTLFGLKDFSIVHSRPSPVESSFAEAPLRTTAACAMKSFWYLTFGAWKLVGGWEICLRRNSSQMP